MKMEFYTFITYNSKNLRDYEKSYAITKLEYWAIVDALYREINIAYDVKNLSLI